MVQWVIYENFTHDLPLGFTGVNEGMISDVEHIKLHFKYIVFSL